MVFTKHDGALRRVLLLSHPAIAQRAWPWMRLFVVRPRLLNPGPPGYGRNKMVTTRQETGLKDLVWRHFQTARRTEGASHPGQNCFDAAAIGSGSPLGQVKYREAIIIGNVMATSKHCNHVHRRATP